MLAKFINWMNPLPDIKVQLQDKQIAEQYKFWRIKMFVGMYIGYLMYYFTRKNLSYAAPSLMNELGITKMNFGILGSIMYVTYGIGKFASGMLADKCNIRTFMAFGLIGSSIINIFFGFLPSFPLLAFFWGINGGLQSMGFPPMAKGVVYWFSPNERGTVWTLFSSSKMAGIALVGILAGFCISAGCWRAAFYIPGILGLITGVWLLFTLTDKPSSVGLPPIEVYRKDILPVKKQSGFSHWQILTKYVFANPYMWFIAIAATFMYFIRFAIVDWNVIFMVERGIENGRAARLLIFMPLIGILGGISAGWISDRFFKGRCVPISLIYLVCLAFSIWGMYHFTDSQTPWWIIAAFLALVGFFIDGPQSVAAGVLVTRITAQESVGTAVGFVGAFEYIGAFFSGIGVSWLTEKFGWCGLFVVCGISCLVAIVFIALTWNRESTNNKKLFN